MSRLTDVQKTMRDALCRNHGGKMHDIISLSTSPFNPVCDRRAAYKNIEDTPYRRLITFDTGDDAATYETVTDNWVN